MLPTNQWVTPLLLLACTVNLPTPDALLVPSLIRSSTTPSTVTTFTAVHAHSQQQAALQLMQGASSSPSASVSDPYTPPAVAQSVHRASLPDPDAADLTGTGDSVRVVTQQMKKNDGPAITNYVEISLSTKEGISLHDITPQLHQAIREAKIQEGWVNVVSRHTTTAVTINECESRLMDDIRQYCLKLAPPSHPYLHNDIHLRPATEEDRRRVMGGGEWRDVEEWRAQEPKNCHAHLLSMLVGNSVSVPVSRGRLRIGRWQSVMMVELDGERERTVGIQVVGYE
ncbi:hypothetical protein VYU27_007845 [Nannochloropsis oceanica]